MKKIKIKNYEIGKNFPPFIIAEAGINHNGDLKKALKMIDIAKNAGVHAIKFQTYDATQMIVNKKLKYSPRSSKLLKLSKEAAEGLNKIVLCKLLLLLFLTSSKIFLIA